MRGWEGTQEDISVVLDEHGVKLSEKDQEKLHGDLDQNLIEDAAMAYDDFDEQSQSANDEIWRQVSGHELLAPWRASQQSRALDEGTIKKGNNDNNGAPRL